MFSTVWNTQRFTELGREEKGGGGGRDNLGEKKESLKDERVVKPVISLSGKMGTEDWVFTCTKLTTNTKKQRLIIWSRDWIFKNTILRKEEGEKRKSKHNKTRKQNNNNKKTKPQELLKNTNNNHPKTIYDVCLKKKVFF